MAGRQPRQAGSTRSRHRSPRRRTERPAGGVRRPRAASLSAGCRPELCRAVVARERLVHDGTPDGDQGCVVVARGPEAMERRTDAVDDVVWRLRAVETALQALGAEPLATLTAGLDHTVGVED